MEVGDLASVLIDVFVSVLDFASQSSLASSKFSHTASELFDAVNFEALTRPEDTAFDKSF